MGPRRLEGVVEETAIVVGRQVGLCGRKHEAIELTRLTG